MARNKATDLKGMSKFDLDLEFGQKFEDEIDNIFSGITTCEIKSERDKWVGYGNMVIETGSNGKPSGLTKTEASMWCHNFTLHGKLIAGVLLPVDVLKDIVQQMKEDGVSRVTKGGDGWRSELNLLPLDRLFEYVIKVAKDRRND